jgi:hypothetical protein
VIHIDPSCSVEGGAKQSVNWTAIGMSVAFVALTLGSAYWAAMRTLGLALMFRTAGCAEQVSPAPHRDRTAEPAHRGLQALLRTKDSDAPPNTTIDLSFAAILKDLGVPPLPQHDAVNDALMSAMMYPTLCDLKERDVRIARPRRERPVFNPTGA